VYGFPLVLMDVTNGILTATSKSGEYSASINQYMRERSYVSPDFKNVVRISVNSLWSVAVLDLDKEPLVASFPAMNERYFVMQMMNMWTDNFGSVGTRTGAAGGGRFLIAGPKWNGQAPPDGPYSAPAVNGWLNPTDLGRYGADYNTRALIAWLGLGALCSEDAMYPSAFVDGDGNVLDGAGKYVMHFEKDGLPPSAAGVWSISPYRGNFYVRNAINRYGILSSMPLKYNDDGSLDIYIQARSPGAEREVNWLLCPAERSVQSDGPGVSAETGAAGRNIQASAGKAHLTFNY
jgi:hypothetical protein